MGSGNERRAIVLVDHGSRREEANRQLVALGEKLEARLRDTIVRTAHMEIAYPTLPEQIASCVTAGATHIVVQPVFLAPGRHTVEDIPTQVEAALRDHPDVEVRIGPVLGSQELLLDLIVACIEAADA